MFQRLWRVLFLFKCGINPPPIALKTAFFGVFLALSMLYRPFQYPYFAPPMPPQLAPASCFLLFLHNCPVAVKWCFTGGCIMFVLLIWCVIAHYFPPVNTMQQKSPGKGLKIHIKCIKMYNLFWREFPGKKRLNYSNNQSFPALLSIN